MSSIILDIETEGLPAEELAALFEKPEVKTLPLFDAVEAVKMGNVKHPGEFDPFSVKVGNLTEDGAKEKVEKARQDHAKAVESYQAKYKEKHDAAKAKYDQELAEENGKVAKAWESFVERAALSPLTGRVLVVGVMQSDGKWEAIQGEESEVIDRTFREVERALAHQAKIVGHCSNKFDFPFLIKRAWKLGIPVPDQIFPDPFWRPNFVDLNKRWQVGNPGMDGKLDEIAKFFGHKGKMAGVTGGEFAGLYRNPDTRAKALEYVYLDLLATLQCANSMQVL